MAQRRRSRQVGEIEWRQVGDSAYAVPRSITMQTGDDAELPFHVEITVENDGERPVCSRLVLEQKSGGVPLTSEGLREIPVRELTQWAAGSLVMRINDPAKGVESGVSMISTRDDVHTAGDAIDGEGRAKRRRITDDDLRRLADVVTRAEATGRSYITMAGLEMGISRDQARQWKRKAIREGFLAPTKETDR